MKLNRLIELLLNYKKSYKLYGKKSPKNYIKYLRANGVTIGEDVIFRYPKHTTIDLNRPWLITIGNNCDFNDNFAIMTHDFMTRVFRDLYDDFIPAYGPVRIGNNCTFGRNVLVTRGVSIGDNCCIGAGSVITKSIPSNSLAAGIPCKRICSVEEYYQKRKKECVEEAIENGVVYFNKFGKLPPMDIFFEEWTLFMNKDDISKYPEMKKHINFRLKSHYNQFFEKQVRAFDGYDEFLKEIENRIQEQIKH
ncbi:MAG: acyltransferase [Muribaculaceae bacterium]|nr:acyltransferase [Muribaculaceae bacterium]